MRENNIGKLIKKATVPFSCFEDVKKDIAGFAEREDLNNFQKWIAAERYILEPQVDFEPKSVIAAAVPSEIYHAVFVYRDKKYASVIDRGYTDEEVKTYLSEGNHYHFFFDYWLPQKRIAVRSGLAGYGKNNICFVEGMGSLINLFCFISDMPYPEKYVWREVMNMPACDDCSLCRENCPTGAIMADRFLIDNQACLSAMNEWGSGPFPDHVPKSAHHRTVHCSRCQDICPKNKGKFDHAVKTINFNEDETLLLLSGEKFESLPAGLMEKIEECNMKWYYDSLPRNLRAMFESDSAL